MDALKTFEPALKRGELAVMPGLLDPQLIVHIDKPRGDSRATYARMRGGSVGGIAIIISAGFEDGVPVYQIGYAVPQHLRKRGIAKELAHAALREFTAGLTHAGITHFYIEAIVGVKNVGSQKVAAHVIGGEPIETEDSNSGEPAFKYIREIGSYQNGQDAA